MTDSALRQQISREVKQALQKAGLSARTAAAKMPRGPDKKPVEGKLLYRWMNAEVTAPLDRLEQFAVAVGQTITLRIGPDTAKDPPPDWARDLTDELRGEIQASRDAVAEALIDAVMDRLRGRLPLPTDDAAAPDSEDPPQATSGAVKPLP